MAIGVSPDLREAAEQFERAWWQLDPGAARVGIRGAARVGLQSSHPLAAVTNCQKSSFRPVTRKSRLSSNYPVADV
jgi:hypothetical protein